MEKITCGRGTGNKELTNVGLILAIWWLPAPLGVSDRAIQIAIIATTAKIYFLPIIVHALTVAV